MRALRRPSTRPGGQRKIPPIVQGHGARLPQVGRPHDPNAMPEIHEHHHTVRDDEIDALGRASNVAYVEWMLRAATEHSALQGWPEEAYLARGYGWVVRMHRIEYLRPALPRDRLVVETWVATLDRVASIRRYRILREESQELLAEAETKWVFIDFKTARPMRIPEEVARAFPVVERPGFPQTAG
jgi:acyl-CoA thioester hydrolase